MIDRASGLLCLPGSRAGLEWAYLLPYNSIIGHPSPDDFEVSQINQKEQCCLGEGRPTV